MILDFIFEHIHILKQLPHFSLCRVIETFTRIHNEVNAFTHLRNKTRFLIRLKDWVFVTNSDFLIPIFFPPDSVNLWCFKLRFFHLSLKYLRSKALVYKDIEIKKLKFVTQFLWWLTFRVMSYISVLILLLLILSWFWWYYFLF